ncbi:MAG: response regulator [Clostridiaceae bacterium]|nr:response regulator [Clostridiaceae bacterium]
MYRLMIVEDEPLTRDAIMKSIDFAAFDFEVVAVCEDGREAAEQYFNLLPDLVITDICMPFMTGLELADQIAKTGRGTRVIILTGYDDFQYAQKAINNQVSKYILKPITSHEFKEILEESKTILDEQQERRRQVDTAQRMLHINSPLVRDQVLNRLLHGIDDLGALANEMRSINISAGKAYYAVSILLIEQAPEAAQKLNVGQELLKFMIFNVVEEMTATVSDALAFTLPDGRTALLCGNDRQNALDEIRYALCGQIHDKIGQLFDIEVTAGMGKIVASLAQLKDSWTEAEHVLEYRSLVSASSILSAEDIKNQSRKFDWSQYEENLITQVRLQDEEKIAMLIEQLMLVLRLSYMSRSDIHFAFSRLADRLLHLLESDDHLSGPNLNLVLPDKNDTDYLRQLQVWLTQFCGDCVRYLRSTRQSSAKRLTAKATQYIRQHYDDNALSLYSLCNHLSVSMSYFSTFFKEETGKTFIEYLTDVRIEKAKDLLVNSDMMLYMIAERVGYENPAYFTVAFKKSTGMKPKEYRKSFNRRN